MLGKIVSISSKANKVVELCAEKDVFYLESTLRFPKESIDEVKQIHEEGYFVRHRGGDSEGWLSCALHGWGAGPRPEYYRTMNPSGYGLTEDGVKYGWTELEEPVGLISQACVKRDDRHLCDLFQTEILLSDYTPGQCLVASTASLLRSQHLH